MAVTGVLHIEQQTQGSQKSSVFDLYMDAVAVEIEDEEFEDMYIDEHDVEQILELSARSDPVEAVRSRGQSWRPAGSKSHRNRFHTRHHLAPRHGDPARD